MNTLVKKMKITATILFAMFVTAAPSVLADTPGYSDNGILNEEWHADFFTYYWGYFGASPAIDELGVNNTGSEPNSDLEIVSGSDDCYEYYPELGAWAPGIWRCFDSQGNIEWATDTQSDEARGDPTIVDLDGDGYLEIVTGTTSGETIEVLDRFGNFFWTFPDPPQSGDFMWDGGPAVADVDPAVSGLEVIASNRPRHEIYALDGDNSDGVDDGYTWPGGPPWTGGVEGVNWDILWIFTVPIACEIYATPAIADVDNDGQLEVAFGATNGVFYVLDAQSGAMETSFSLGGAIYASAAVCNLDSDPNLEMVIGSTSGNVYALQWDGTTASTEWTYATGGAVYSSAAIGDIDGDGSPEVVVGSNDNNIYALDASGTQEWSYPTGGAVYSSPSLAYRGTGVSVYVGSEDTYLYLLDGAGSLIDRFQTHSGACGGMLMTGGIHTSPSIADVDGDGKLEIFFYDWGCGSANNGNTFWALEDSNSNVAPYSIEWANFRSNPERTGCYIVKVIPVAVDIKPQSCPNPLNLKSNGVLPVGILGTADFDTTTVDLSTLELNGVPAIEDKVGVDDVGTPFDGELCDCTDAGADGYADVTVFFYTQAIVEALGSPADGDEIELTLTGLTYDGVPIQGSDCILVRNKGQNN